MPELAEVEYYRKQWLPGLGQKVVRVHAHPKARIFRETPAREIAGGLKGTVFTGAAAHGKQLCFRFGERIWLGLHLGMAGKLLTGTPEMVPDKHEHLVLVMETLSLVFSDYRMFGKVTLHAGNEAPPWWLDLPPQPQEAAFDWTYFRSLLPEKSRRPLKAILLDQALFPGIGNWMADEILWRAGVHPAETIAALSRQRRQRLFHCLKEVVGDALRVIGTTWEDPPDDWLFPHRWRRGGTCPASGKPLTYETIGGRTTCYSPAKQKKKT